MTLVLTEVSPFGIAMAADTAVTVSFPGTGLAFAEPNSAVKLQVVSSLNAGVVCWGRGTIAGKSTDLWLSEFIEDNSDAQVLAEFADRLAEALNNQVGSSSDGSNRLGFHLAGFEPLDESMTPSFYHIHDGPSTTLKARGIDVDPSKFNANHDLPPEICRSIFKKGGAWITRNGDYRFYALMFQRLEALFRDLRQDGIAMPNSQDIEDRARYLVFQIRTVANLYRLSNLIPGIGGAISYLAISPDGIQSHGVKYQ